MRQEFKQSINEAKKFISKIKDSAHNFTHVKSVVDFALRIAKEYHGTNSDLIEVAAWWHDVGRLYDKAHEKLSADMAFKSLKKLNVDYKTCKKIHDAIIYHKWSMQPKTIEGEIIRDADKLGFISIRRWKYCLKNNNIDDLQDLTNYLPRLRNEFLHLEISKRIYDKEIIGFVKFIKSIKVKNFIEVKKKILAYDLC
jgi:HD superfamily phosphodiesterase